jgi:hypothetical protein
MMKYSSAAVISDAVGILNDFTELRVERFNFLVASITICVLKGNQNVQINVMYRSVSFIMRTM